MIDLIQQMDLNSSIEFLTACMLMLWLGTGLVAFCAAKIRVRKERKRVPFYRTLIWSENTGYTAVYLSNPKMYVG
jgi:cytochrome c oxidase assembly factor CtaG